IPSGLGSPVPSRPARSRWGGAGTGVGQALTIVRRDRQQAGTDTVRSRARAEVGRMIVLTAVLVVAGIVLAAPSDQGARLRQLLPRDDDDDAGRPARGLFRRGGTPADSQAERLWAIAAVEYCAHLLRVGMTPQAVMAT